MAITSVASGVFFIRCVIFGRRKSFLKLGIFMAITSVASGVFFIRCVIFGRRKSFLKLEETRDK